MAFGQPFCHRIEDTTSASLEDHHNRAIVGWVTLVGVSVVGLNRVVAGTAADRVRERSRRLSLDQPETSPAPN